MKLRVRSLMLLIVGLAIYFAAWHWSSRQDENTKFLASLFLLTLPFLIPFYAVCLIFAWVARGLFVEAFVPCFARRSTPSPNQEPKAEAQPLD